jgi:hypothetical protein
LRKRAYFGGIFGIPPSGITHRGENSMPFTRQGFREHPAEASAGAGDENHLAGIHAYRSLPVVTISCCNQFDAGSKVWIQNEFSGLLTGQNETQAVHGSTVRAYRLSTASRSQCPTEGYSDGLSAYRRQPGSYPETGFAEVDRIGRKLAALRSLFRLDEALIGSNPLEREQRGRREVDYGYSLPIA